MNSPDPSEEQDLRTRASAPGLSLKDYVEREFAAIAAAGGPTMATILDDLDGVRDGSRPAADDIVHAVHDERRDRAEHLERLWQR